MDYNSPFPMMQDSNPVPDNPFWSGVRTGENRQIAMPFIQRAGEAQSFDLLKKKMETGEFTSPEAQGARMSGYARTQAENQQATQNAPVMGELARKEAAEKMRSLPYVTDEMIAKAQHTTRAVKSIPIRELLSELGNNAEHIIGGQDEGEKAFRYMDVLNRWRQKNPDLQIPPEIAAYRSDRTLAELASLRISQLDTPEQIGRERLEGMQQTGANSRNQVSANAQIQSAQIAADASRFGASQRAATEKPPNIPHRIVQLRKAITADPNDIDSKTELSYHLNDQFVTKVVPNDPLLKILSIQALSNPQAAEQYEKMYDQRRQRFMQENGVGDSSPKPKDDSGKDIQSQATQSFGAYEPEKYEYRVNNGRLQRKPKKK